jgi:hypothetical protein
MKNKIKAVEMTRKIREKQYADIKDKDHKEILNYFKSHSKELLKKNKTVT